MKINYIASNETDDQTFALKKRRNYASINLSINETFEKSRI